MKKSIAVAVAASALIPGAASAQGEQERLARLEVILVTAAKTQTKSFAPDAKTQALLAEIAKAK